MNSNKAFVQNNNIPPCAHLWGKWRRDVVSWFHEPVKRDSVDSLWWLHSENAQETVCVRTAYLVDCIVGLRGKREKERGESLKCGEKSTVHLICWIQRVSFQIEVHPPLFLT